jgi:hypothetical protein
MIQMHGNARLILKSPSNKFSRSEVASASPSKIFRKKHVEMKEKLSCRILLIIDLHIK